MAPLCRYYLSFAGMLLLGLGIAALPPGNEQTAGVVVLLSLAGYMVFVRWPKCRIRLSAMGDSPGIHGVPGRRCPNCGADLSKSTG
jgi:hypothetical protein